MSGDFWEYEVSTAAENHMKISCFLGSPSLCTNCFAHSFVRTCCWRRKMLNTRPVAFPLSPSILFLYILVPFGVFWMICFFFSSRSPALSSKEKNQWTQPGFGSSFNSSLISCGVSASHSGSGRLQLIYSLYTSKLGSSGFRVAMR